jgi:lysophospholipase L1-like esterase
MRVRRFLPAFAISAALVTVAGCSSTPPPVSDKVASYYESHKDLVQSAAATKAAIVTSILSDSHAFNADSWWRQTVMANKASGMTTGAFESQPGAGAGAAALAKRLDAAAAKKGLVIVQAGSNDLLSGTSPADTAAGVEALWKGIRDRGATPVVALVPPSNDVPAEVLELNRILIEEAMTQRLDVIDVFTPVANKDGSWAGGNTTDGTHANKAGSDVMTAAVLRQLPSLID